MYPYNRECLRFLKKKIKGLIHKTDTKCSILCRDIFLFNHSIKQSLGDTAFSQASLKVGSHDPFLHPIILLALFQLITVS